MEATHPEHPFVPIDSFGQVCHCQAYMIDPDQSDASSMFSVHSDSVAQRCVAAGRQCPQTLGGGVATPELAALVQRARGGDPRAVARLITRVEAADPKLPELAAVLAGYVGQAQVIGLTKAPGVGKSTTTSELVGELRTAGHRVGVIAVDPASPFTGGAILGDRVRMQDHATDPDVFIRSMSSRGQLGGL